MYSDTHFHFRGIAERGVEAQVPSAKDILCSMAQSDVFFGLDIGTEYDDLLARRKFFLDALSQIDDETTRKQIESFFYFSAGIWPSQSSIQNRNEYIEILQKQIESFRAQEDSCAKHLVAIGEGGIDHHWDKDDVENRLSDEKELFEMQLYLAKKMQLPFIVHSRDGFDDTIECIKRCRWNTGIIHCYSYGVEEAKKFLDLGWHIALGGSVTYTKKSRMDDMLSLIRMIPDDALLLETDSPYLSPVPLRGTVNTPLNISHTYRFISDARGMEVQELSDLVDRNCARLFGLR